MKTKLHNFRHDLVLQYENRLENKGLNINKLITGADGINDINAVFKNPDDLAAGEELGLYFVALAAASIYFEDEEGDFDYFMCSALDNL